MATAAAASAAKVSSAAAAAVVTAATVATAAAGSAVKLASDSASMHRRGREQLQASLGATGGSRSPAGAAVDRTWSATALTRV